MPDFIIAHHKTNRPLKINQVQESTIPKAILQVLKRTYKIQDFTMQDWSAVDLLRWAARHGIFISKPTQAHAVPILPHSL